MARPATAWGATIIAAIALAACAPGQSEHEAGHETPTPTGTGTPNPSPTSTPAPSKTIRLVALGDTGTGSPEQYQVAAAIKDKCDADGCDFGVLLGDNFYPSGVSGVDDPQWQEKLELPYAELDFPFYMILGNHDYGGDGAGYEFGLGANQVDYAAVHDKWILPAEYYAFDDGAATFLGLGTNLIFWDQANAVAEQGAYFTDVLGQSDKPWRIAIGHHPYLSNGTHGNAGSYDNVPYIPIANGENVKTFFDDYMCSQVDLYLSGHDHSRQIIEGPAECPVTFVVSGAGAKTTDLPGSNPAVFEKAYEGFAYLVIDDESITIEMYGMDGVFEDSYQITK